MSSDRFQDALAAPRDMLGGVDIIRRRLDNPQSVTSLEQARAEITWLRSDLRLVMDWLESYKGARDAAEEALDACREALADLQGGGYE